LATAIQKRFLGPLARKKFPKVSVFEGESSCQRHDSTSFLSNTSPWTLDAINEKSAILEHLDRLRDRLAAKGIVLEILGVSRVTVWNCMKRLGLKYTRQIESHE
jgi:hypothetical protein